MTEAPVDPLEPGRARALADALSQWFTAEARDLSWRRTRDPYAIWVSEVMLQQTRVDTVERYWPRFMARFPDLRSLAAADEDEVLAQWSGLGYYRRARLLHQGAKYVAEQLDGRVPADPGALRKIPGVGRYTTGAIASIAFDQPVPLVDGNVARVHSRLAAITDPRQQDASHEGHWRYVAQVLAEGSPRVLAQALMELGATICTPRSPSCERCPVRGHCRAAATGQVGTIPAAKVKRESPNLYFHALAIRYGERVLVERRPDGGLLAGLWCLPLIAREPGEVRPSDAETLAATAEAELGVPLRIADAPAPAVKHVFSHRVWHIVPWPARAGRAVKLRGRADGRCFAWFDQAALLGGIPTLTRKLLDAAAR